MTAARFRRALIVIALVGLALRLVYAYVIVKSRPLLGDALEFQQQANLLASGHGLIQPTLWYGHHIARPSADKPPVYPFLEAAISLLGGRTWAWHDIVDLVAGTATVWVTGLVGRRVGGHWVGLLAAGVAAAYPLLIAADGSLRSEPVFALLVTLSLLAALRLREAPSTGRAAVLGAVIGLAALTRAEALLLVVLLPFGLAGLRRGLISVATCVLVLSPWLVRSWIAFGQPVLISNNVGGLLAGANCGPTYSGSLLGQWDLFCLPRARYANQARESDRLRDLGLRYARRHSGRLPEVIAARLGRSFDVFRPQQDWAFESFLEGRDLDVERVGVFVYYAVALLAIAGTVVLVRRRGPWGILLSPLVLVVFVSITGYGFTRFRVGAEPALIVLAAVALEAAAVRWIGARRRSPAAAPSPAPREAVT
ncbi:MAG TPA: glycosyltransferase family 39 protein [Solirubrobacteraceae bacterium]|jgi:4-amino-4-deoxy-L-arabinose transferase-like glycosyltransferase